jgi:hypothetical protein
MKAAAVASVLVACSGLAAGPPGGRVPATATVLAPPVEVRVDTLLGRTAEEGSVVLRLSVARQHPLGARIEPFILAWPGWGATLSAITHQPLEDLDWIELVGPRDPAGERLLTRTLAADDVVDARLQARSDGSLRVVDRPQPHLVAALPPDGAAAILATLRTARVLEPAGSDPDEALHVDFPHPHGVVLYVPEEARRAVVRVDSRPGGAAEGFVDLTCDDEAAASLMAARLQARASEINNLIVRVLTRDLLGSLTIAVEGPVVKLRLPATSEQLESLATLAAAVLPGAGLPSRLPP